MPEDFSLPSVQVAQSPEERFDEYLESRGLRKTKQRRVIVGQVFARHSHFDADELAAELAKLKGDRRVSRATVYRTVNELVEAGLLVKMDLGGRAVYEHDYGYPQHDHLYCQQCQKLIEFRSDEVRDIRDAVAREHDFRVTGHRLIIHGVCQDCRKRSKRKKSPLDLI